MKRTKKLLSGLLVLMLLAGLMVMPVGAAEDTTDYATYGGFEGTSEVGQDGVTTKIQGWDIKDASYVSIVKEGDDGYVGYGEEGTVSHGNYLKIPSGGSGNGLVIGAWVAMPAETTYEITMRAYATSTGDFVRFHINGKEYWWTTSEANVWKTVRMTLTIPEGKTGETIYLRYPGREVYYDDLRVTKATNLLHGYNFAETKYFDENLAQFRKDYEGEHYWFSTKTSTSEKTAITGSGEGALINGEQTLEQIVPVKPGATYRLRANAWARAADGQMDVTVSFADKQDGTLSKTFTGISTSSDAANSFHTYYFHVPNITGDNGEQKALTDAHIKYSCTEGTIIDFRWAELVEVEEGKISFIGVRSSKGEYHRELPSLNNALLDEENNTYTLCVMGEIENAQYGGSEKASLVIGYYEGTQLKNVEVEPITCAEDAAAECVVRQITVPAAQTVKVFLWNSLGGLTPICDDRIVQ